MKEKVPAHEPTPPKLIFYIKHTDMNDFVLKIGLDGGRHSDTVFIRQFVLHATVPLAKLDFTAVGSNLAARQGLRLGPVLYYSSKNGESKNY